MKEYKVINWKMGLTKNNEKLEDTLNQYAREGWKAIQVAEQTARIVFERDKTDKMLGVFIKNKLASYES